MRTRSSYSAVAICLHWLVAFAVACNFWVGWRMGRIDGFARFQLFQLHKSIGISILLLTLVRVFWRAIKPPPPLPQSMSGGARLAAGGAHVLLYVLMLGIPATGWVVVSASLYNIPTLLFGVVPWPHIGAVQNFTPAVRRLVEAQVGSLHAWLAWSMLALLVLHVAAALKHHLLDRDDILSRMLPLVRRASILEE